MVLIRTVVAALIVISVAILPATGEAIVPPSPGQAMIVDQAADMPCCPCCNTQNDFKSTACALMCVTVATVILPATAIALHYVSAGAPQPFADDLLHEFLKAPPTHPPPA